MKRSTGFFFIIACAWSVMCGAQSDCGIGLRLSTAVPTIVGLESAGEWSDTNTSVLNASSPCFEQLKDYVAGTYADRPVTVKSKRYQRGGNWYLGFLFDVRDISEASSCDGHVCIGEKIVMQFNRRINGDAKLNTAEDKRLTLTHQWVAAAGGTLSGEIQVASPIGDSTCTATSGVDVQWGPDASSGIGFSIRRITGAGYRAEIEVPTSFIGVAGDLTEDIGVAFAVVNDFGRADLVPSWDCTASGTCDAAAASFPRSLPETVDANPVDALCEKGWVVPRQWGVGYRISPPAQVTISRLDKWWDSKAIRAYHCDTTTPSYTHYPAKPCRVRIEADLTNDGATARRHVLFLWAKHGSGDPLEYNFVDMKKDVVVNPATASAPGSTTVSSSTWSGMPMDPAHPCLRVYSFPDTVTPAHENILRGASSGGVVSRMNLGPILDAYGVQEQHWAQKNISAAGQTSQCPSGKCPVSSLNPLRIAIVGSAWAQAVVTPPGGGLPGPITDLPAGSDLARYAKDHVIVQTSTVAWRVPSGKRRPLYNFVEDFGGVVQAVPMTLVNANRLSPIEFQVSNGSDSTMQVKLITQTSVPAGSAAGIRVNFSTRELTLKPRSVVTVKGSVENPNVEQKKSRSICDSLKFGSLPGAMLAFAGVAGWWTRRRK